MCGVSGVRTPQASAPPPRHQGAAGEPAKGFTGDAEPSHFQPPPPPPSASASRGSRMPSYHRSYGEALPVGTTEMGHQPRRKTPPLSQNTAEGRGVNTASKREGSPGSQHPGSS